MNIIKIRLKKIDNYNAPEGMPKLVVKEIDEPEVTVTRNVKEMFMTDQSLRKLKEHGIDSVVICTSLGRTVTKDSRLELEEQHPDSLIVYNYSVNKPDFDPKRHTFKVDKIGEIHVDNLNVIHVKQNRPADLFNNPRGFTLDDVWNAEPVPAGADTSFINDGDTVVGQIIGNNLFALVDYLHDDETQVPLLKYYINKYVAWREGEEMAQPEHPDLPTLDIYNEKKLVELYKQGYENVHKKGYDEKLRQRSENKMKAAFDAYQQVVQAEAKQLAILDQFGEYDEEKIKKRALGVMNSIMNLPDVRGVSIRDGHLRIITHPMESPRWSNKKKALAIWIPIDFQTRGGFGGKIRIHTIDEKARTTTPNKFDLFCLGTLAYSFDVNMLTGDWDTAVITVLKLIKTYRQMRTPYGVPIEKRNKDFDFKGR